MKEYLFVNILLINSKSTKPMHLQHVLEMPTKQLPHITRVSCSTLLPRTKPQH